MKNNFGFAKYEVVTVILLILIVSSFILYSFLGGLSNQKIKTMKESAASFAKTVAANIDSFHNVDTVYLGEGIEQKIIKDIKNPTGIGNCDITESKVKFSDGAPFVTLRCGNYLIDNESISNIEKIKLYKVGSWDTKKEKGYEKRVLFNCEKDGKLVFDEYYEELYFVSLVNDKFNTEYYFSNDVNNTCKVVNKTFYREKELAE